MSRSFSASRSAIRVPLTWLVAAVVALCLSIAAGIALTELLMSPPRDEQLELGAYLAISGTASLAFGWAVYRAVDRMFGLTLRAKAFVATGLAGVIALLNVIVVAELMFISTGHDLKLLLALIGFSGVITAFFSLWAASSLSQRVTSIAFAVRRLAAGDLRASVDSRGADEVARLAGDVNLLAAQLEAAGKQREALDRERRELTAAVSHDLRTPLSSLRAMVEALSDRVVIDPAEIDRYYATMRHEVDRLSRMIDDLFELTQIDAGVLRLDRQRVNIAEIGAEVVDAMQANALLTGVSISIEPGPPAYSNADGARIARALSNLVRNAIEHTPRGGKVQVIVRPENSVVAVDVSDSGNGVAEEDIPHIWERFYRGEKSRRRAPGSNNGAGLGLAIVRGIVEAHGGSVEVKSSQKGATFSVRLPVHPTGPHAEGRAV